MKSNCLFILLFFKQFFTDSVEQEDYISQIEMRNGNITDIYQANIYKNIDGIQNKKSDDFYKQIANVETFQQIDVTKKDEKKSRKLLDQPVYLYKQLHMKTNDEIQQFRANLRQTRQELQNQTNLYQQPKKNNSFAQQFKIERSLSLLSRQKQLDNITADNKMNNLEQQQQTEHRPLKRNLRQKKRKLFMPPMVIMFSPHMYTPEVQSPQMRINLGENKILYDKAKKEAKSESIPKVKNVFSVNSPDYMPRGRGLSTVDVRKQWKLFRKKYLIQII